MGYVLGLLALAYVLATGITGVGGYLDDDCHDSWHEVYGKLTPRFMDYDDCDPNGNEDDQPEGQVDPRIATAQAERDAKATEAAVQATLTAIAQSIPTAQTTSPPETEEEGQEESGEQLTPTAQAGEADTQGDTGTGANEAVLEGTVLHAGDAALIRTIQGNTATVCYSQSLPTDIKVGKQNNGEVVAAWARPDRQPWGWMMGDAANEAQRIREGSLTSEGVTDVQGPMVCP